MARKRKPTPEEIEARQLTEIWNTPLVAKGKPAPPPPLLCGVPWFDSADSFGGHSPDCNCNDCFSAFAYKAAAEERECW